MGQINIKSELDQAIAEADRGQVEMFDDFDDWASSLDEDWASTNVQPFGMLKLQRWLGPVLPDWGRSVSIITADNGRPWDP